MQVENDSSDGTTQLVHMWARDNSRVHAETRVYGNKKRPSVR